MTSIFKYDEPKRLTFTEGNPKTDKNLKLEEFKKYCWDMYVANCTERSDEGEGLITFLEYSESNKDFLKYKFTRK